MIYDLILAVSLTIGVSALCSTLEALILSVTSAEIENLKISSPRKGSLLEKFHEEIEETSSAISKSKHHSKHLRSNPCWWFGRKCSGGWIKQLINFCLWFNGWNPLFFRNSTQKFSFFLPSRNSW